MGSPRRDDGVAPQLEPGGEAGGQEPAGGRVHLERRLPLRLRLVEAPLVLRHEVEGAEQAAHPLVEDQLALELDLGRAGAQLPVERDAGAVGHRVGQLELPLGGDPLELGRARSAEGRVGGDRRQVEVEGGLQPVGQAQLGLEPGVERAVVVRPSEPERVPRLELPRARAQDADS